MNVVAKEMDGVKTVFDIAITTGIKGYSPQQMRAASKHGKGCYLM